LEYFKIAFYMLGSVSIIISFIQIKRKIQKKELPNFKWPLLGNLSLAAAVTIGIFCFDEYRTSVRLLYGFVVVLLILSSFFQFTHKRTGGQA